MGLKSIRLGRAEDLPDKIRLQYDLPKEGMIIIESRNPEPNENIISITSISEYLKSLGNFKEYALED